MATRLKEPVRGEDKIAGLGGDAFAAPVESATRDDLVALVTKKIVEAWSKSFPIVSAMLARVQQLGLRTVALGKC